MRRSPLERSGLSMAATKQIHHRPKYQSNFVSKISAKILNTLERIMNKIPNIFSYEYTTPAKIQANKVQVSHKPACRKSNLDCAGNRKTSIKKTHYDVPVHCRTRLDSTKRAQSCKCLEPDAALAALRFAANIQFTRPRCRSCQELILSGRRVAGRCCLGTLAMSRMHKTR